MQHTYCKHTHWGLTQKKASALQQKRHQPHNNKNCHTEKKAKIDFAKIAKINIFINSDKDFGKFYKSYQRALFMLSDIPICAWPAMAQTYSRIDPMRAAAADGELSPGRVGHDGGRLEAAGGSGAPK